MFFELNDKKTYGVKFSRISTTTLAVLHVVLDDGTLMNTNITGIARLYYKDRFKKSTGRKEALASLLKQMSEFPDIPKLEKEDRAKIWEIYFKTHKK